MDFTLHQLKVFGMVARHKSMTQAARELHMTQPAVSIQIKQLQNAVGIPLIEVIGRQLYLTEAGEHLYGVYQRVTNELEALEANVSQLKGGLSGTLTISAASTAKYFLPYLLGEFQRRYPRVEISLKVTNRNEVLQYLQGNEYDISILTQLPDDDSITAIPFLENPLVLGAPPGHPLSDEKHIDPARLRKETFIYREPGSGTRMVMKAYMERHNIAFKPNMELGTNEAIKQAIMAGIGISVISKLSLANELKLEQIALLPAEEFPIMTRWHALYKNAKQLTPVTRNFLDFLQEKDLKQYLPSDQL